MSKEKKKQDVVGTYLVERIKELEKANTKLLERNDFLSYEMDRLYKEKAKLEKLRKCFVVEGLAIYVYDFCGGYVGCFSIKDNEDWKVALDVLNLKEEEE